MKRFIRYLYEYEQGRRLRNVGFVKVEQGDDDCTLHIHGKGLHMKGERKLQVYIFYEDGDDCVGIWQGAIDNVNPAINYRLYYTDEDVLLPDNFERINGIILESELGHRYAAIWNEDLVNVGHMRILRPEMIHDKEAGDSDTKEAEVQSETSKEQTEEARQREEQTEEIRQRENQREEQTEEIRQREEAGEIGQREEQAGEIRQREEAGEIGQREEQAGETRQREEAGEISQREEQAEEIRQGEERSEGIGQREEQIDGKRQREEQTEETWQKDVQEERRTDDQSGPEQYWREEAVRDAAERMRSDEEEGQPDVGQMSEDSQMPDAGQMSEDSRMPDAGGMPENLTKQPENGTAAQDISVTPEERIQCTKIQRNDLARLPRCEWKWANNSFLLHGYYNYHHLALIDDGNRFRLGIPGIYHPQEAKAASMFGFNEFVPIQSIKMDLTDEEKSSDDQFGYWCRPVKRPLKM